MAAGVEMLGAGRGTDVMMGAGGAVGGVETQVSMGAYRPYSKTLYWTC